MSSVDTQPARSGGDARQPVSRGALLRYRVLALTTAILLLPLIFVATPLDLIWHVSGPAAVIGFLHGWLYVLYLIFGFMISIQLKLPLGRMLLVLLAGTVPFAGFFAERYVTHAYQRATGGSPAGPSAA